MKLRIEVKAYKESSEIPEKNPMSFMFADRNRIYSTMYLSNKTMDKVSKVHASITPLKESLDTISYDGRCFLEYVFN